MWVPEWMTSAPTSMSELITPVIRRSLPGIGVELRMTVSSGPISTHLLSPSAISDSAERGSACEPVPTMSTS